MSGYKLITVRIAQDVYQHKLFLNGSEINICNLPDESRDLVETLGRKDVRTLEHMKEKGIERNELKSGLVRIIK